VKKPAIRKLAIDFFQFITKRGKLVVLVSALITMIFLTGVLCGFTMSNIRLNYKYSVAIPNHVEIITPDQQNITSSTSPTNPTQPKINFQNQTSSDYYSNPPNNTPSNEVKTDFSNQTSGSYSNPSNNTSTETADTENSDSGGLKAIGIEVYRDSSLTSKAITTDWGVLWPGAQKNFTIYVRNEGNSPVTLSMVTSNWTPSIASSYLTLTWDYDGRTINPWQNMKITLTLTVSPDITGITNFGFDIIIVGSA
jgi:hypothetical protein